MVLSAQCICVQKRGFRICIHETHWLRTPNPLGLWALMAPAFWVHFHLTPWICLIAQSLVHDLIVFFGSIPFYFVLASLVAKLKIWRRESLKCMISPIQPSVLQAFQVSRRCLDLTLIGILGAWSCSLTFFVGNLCFFFCEKERDGIW